MKIRRLEVVAWVLIGTATTLLAADGTWIAPGGGAWSDTSKWQNQTVAEGSGATATFDAAGSGTVNNDMTALALRGVLLGGAGYTLAGNTLALDAARLPRTDLHVTSGATLNLAFTGKQYVHALFVNGAPMPGGCYTAANAAWITGPGTLIVTYPPSGSILFLR